MIVNIAPLPLAYRSISNRFRPKHPPIFQGDGEPTDADIELARELFLELDPESQEWYRGCGAFEGLRYPAAGS